MNKELSLLSSLSRLNFITIKLRLGDRSVPIKMIINLYDRNNTKERFSQVY